MKKTLIVALLALAALAANAQAKKKVAVFPFEVADNVVNASEARTIREDFSNRLTQTGLFELVPRAEVDKLFKQEAAFQLNDLSDSKKTAEYGRVLNADWIMAGRFSKVGSRIALVVSMYTYPDFVQKPGAQAYAAYLDALVDSIPAMIADIENANGDGTARPARPASARARPPAQTAPDGTYTFKPRIQASQGARDVDVYLDRIVVRRGYITVYLINTPKGEGSSYGSRLVGNWEAASLKDTDNNASKLVQAEPRASQTYGSVSEYELTYENFSGTHLVIASADSPPIEFYDVVLNKPDK